MAQIKIKMPKIFHCSKCQNKHEQPVGKKCQVKLAGESFSSTSEVAASSSTSDITAVSDQILTKLQQIGEQMELMDRRVQRTEAALEQGSSRVSPLPSTSLPWFPITVLRFLTVMLRKRMLIKVWSLN